MKVYRTAPQQERKAAAELRRARHRAYVPMENRTHKGPKGKTILRKRPIMPGYVCADSKPAESRYVRECIGTINRDDLSALYKHRRTDIPKARVVGIGDHVTLPPIGVHKIEMRGTVIGRRGNRLRVDVGGRIVTVHADQVCV